MQLVSDIFDAFAWRERPSRESACWRSCDFVCLFGHFGMDAPSEWWRPGPSDDATSLSDIAPKDLTLEVYGESLLCVGEPAKAEFVWPNPLTCMKKEAFLYYLPAFLAFCMEEPDVKGLWLDTIRWKFRPCFPFRSGAVDGWHGWREELLKWSWDSYHGRFCLKNAQHWFLTGEDWRRTADLTSSMTARERHVVAAYFDFHRLHGDNVDPDSDAVEFRCASALLRGQSANMVLGARSERDNAWLLKALDALRVRFPAAADELADVECAIGEGTTIDALLAPNTKGKGKVL